MQLQMFSPPKRFVTVRAHKRLNIRVGLQVPSKTFSSLETGPAHLARKRFLVRMRFFVLREECPHSESFRAQLASVGFQTAVPFRVQQPRLSMREILAANIANESLGSFWGVGFRMFFLDVLLQCFHGAQSSFAYDTIVGWNVAVD